jgi:hypothetical protein
MHSLGYSFVFKIPLSKTVMVYKNSIWFLENLSSIFILGCIEFARSWNFFVRTLPSYIQDTTDFINKLNSILFCMDVKGLYPSTPKKGLDACKQALDNRPNPSIPTTDVLSMIHLVLENNNFSFNGSLG